MVVLQLNRNLLVITNIFCCQTPLLDWHPIRSSYLSEILIVLFFLPATEYHLGLLKAKLAKYRAQLLEPSKSAGAKGEGFDVMKSGDARVALIGFPSVGKVRKRDRFLCFPL